jgi:hypothetical protein
MVGVWEGWVGGYGCSLIPLCIGCTYRETYAQDIMFIQLPRLGIDSYEHQGVRILEK